MRQAILRRVTTRRQLLVGLGALASTPALACPKPARLDPGPKPDHAGFNLAHLHREGFGYGSERSRAQLVRLVELGVTHVALTPFAGLRDLTSSAITMSGDKTLTDEHLVREAENARALGLAVTMKPHIWSWQFWTMGKSRQDIVPADIVAWEKAYTAFAVHYAKVAERCGAVLYCVGLEYLAVTKAHPGLWGRVADACREHFSGQLTYAANWWEEAEAFADWKAFDLIGVNAYYPLSGAKDPGVSQLIDGWRPHVDALCDLSTTHDRPVLLCEAGLRAIQGAAEKPWEHGDGGTPDGELQGRAYLALLRAFADQPWWKGVYWWKWFTDHDARESDPYSPMGQPAEKVLRAWWTSP